MVPPRTLRAVLGALFLTSLVAVAPAATAPPPEPFCDACGDSLEATAGAVGVDVAVERSAATLRVAENGSATWVVRNRLADGAAELRENATLRNELADRAKRNAALLGSSVSADGVLVARYRDPDFAEPGVGGTLRSGAFTRAYGYRNLHGLGADELVVVTPEGMRVGWTPPGATVSDDGGRMTLSHLEYGFVTFAPQDAALAPASSVLAVAALVAPAVAANLLAHLALPAALFAGFVAVLGTLLSWLGRRYRFERVRDAVGRVLFAGGALVTGLSLLAGGVSILGGAAAPLVGAGVGLAALGGVLSRPSVGERATYRTALAAAALGAFVAAGSTVAVAIAFEQNGLTYSLLSGLSVLVPVFALFPAGYAFGRGDRRLAVGTAAAGFACSVAPFVPLIQPSVRWVLLAVFAFAYAGVLAVVGSPLFAAGASVADGVSD